MHLKNHHTYCGYYQHPTNSYHVFSVCTKFIYRDAVIYWYQSARSFRKMFVSAPIRLFLDYKRTTIIGASIPLGTVSVFVRIISLMHRNSIIAYGSSIVFLARVSATNSFLLVREPVVYRTSLRPCSITFAEPFIKKANMNVHLVQLV